MYDSVGAETTLDERLSGGQPAERRVRDQRAELARRGRPGGRRARAGLGRAHPHGQGRDRGRGQHRAAGHTGPTPAKAGPAPVPGELDIHPRGGRLAAGDLREQRTDLGLNHGRGLLVDRCSAAAARWPPEPAAGAGPSARRTASRARAVWLFTVPGEQPRICGCLVDVQVAVKAQHQRRALPGRQRRHRRPQVKHGILIDRAAGESLTPPLRLTRFTQTERRS